jgi:NAD+ kinase
MKQIAVLYHPKLAGAEPLAHEVAAWLRERAVSAWVGPTHEEAEISRRLPEFSLLIVLGGDGSTLRAARLAMANQTPILGINKGRIGFLSEANPDNWQERLQRVLDGDYWLEKRLMLASSVHREGATMGTFAALNDVVVGRGQQARVLRLHLRVDGDLVTTYTADGLIVATPTGSTAYSMAAGGPILPPQLQNFVIVPVAAHLSLDRALVLHEEASISIEVEMDHEANLMADGQDGLPLQNGDEVIVTKHAQATYFARVESSGYFYRRLMRRLGFVRQQPDE